MHDNDAAGLCRQINERHDQIARDEALARQLGAFCRANGSPL
jgi:hypothetical protein